MIDTTFDFNSESGDADRNSPTLRRYHQILWSKALPTGVPFTLDAARPRNYLYHSSEAGTFSLSSDAITTRLLGRASRVIAQVPPGQMPPYRGYTIGSALLFPGDQRPGTQSVNQARGRHAKIADRFDLTLECIRRHYVGEASPLAKVLANYGDFFALFVDFGGYVGFWLLQDLTDRDQVRFWLPFDDFSSTAVPQDVGAYLEYSRGREDFITARNHRIDEYVRDIRAGLRPTAAEPSRIGRRRPTLSTT